jgi:hypothetical protein
MTTFFDVAKEIRGKIISDVMQCDAPAQLA